MKLLLHFIWSWLIFCHVGNIHAQFYVTGEAPSSVKWKQIETESFKVVFPSGLYEDANRYANMLEYYKQQTMDLSINSKRKMPVVLQGLSVLSNGYVAWAPKRMEIVPIPPQDSYAQDWLSQLAVHEFRHVAQLDNINKGFTRVLAFLTGQISTGVSSAMIPAWLYEGDAVLHETSLSYTGRGRLPGFEMSLRTMILASSKQFSYDKAFFGSFKDYVPNHYQYGYQLASYANSRYGNDIWPKAFEYTGKHMFLISPLAIYLKKNYGINKMQLYQQTLDSIKYMYNKQKEDITYTDNLILSHKRSNSYTSYILPRFIDSSRIVCLKTSINHLDKLVIIDSTGYERDLTIMGVNQGISLSASENFIVWDELVSDIRWAKRSYSEIRLLDLNTNKIRTVARRTRFFSPDISMNEDRIVAVETDVFNRHYLVILDVATSNVVKRIAAENNVELQTPRWNRENKIVVITVGAEGKTIAEVDPESGVWETLLSHTSYNISEPVTYEEYVIFRGSFNGIEDIFALSRSTGCIYQITSSRYGAFHPAVSYDSSRLVYSEYSIKGFDLVEIPLDTLLWNVITIKQGPSGIWFDGKPGQSEVFLNGNNPPDHQYNTKPYRKVLNFFGFHSWLPFYTDLSNISGLEDFQILPGVMFMSQNLLETSISTIGYTYNDGNHILKPALRWSGWYPVIEISGEFGFQKSNTTISENQDLHSPVTANHSFKLKTSLPLVFTRGKTVKRFQPSIEYQHEGISFEVDEDVRQGLDYLHTRLYFSVYNRLSTRDLYPRLGAEFILTYTHTPVNKTQFGDLYSMVTNMYLPGIGGHHHFYIYAGVQKQLIREYYLPINRIRYPRGYVSALSKFYGSLAANYAFPVFYPDWSINSILYVKRIKANLFFDYGYGIDIIEHKPDGYSQYTGKNYSFGTELTADFHPLRFIFPVTAGIRTGYIPLRNEVFTDFLFRISTNL